ncbi:hypothetical protein HZC00_04670 [Candidatus Kaiserbacteria bacterium]|nr:hypothetical protein [Candidatus Kaiserbacteria bacterium]
MTHKLSWTLFVLVALTGFVFAFTATTAHADHSWGGYHWARTTNPLTLKLGDDVTSAWDSYLQVASTDWSLSSVLDTTIVAGRSNPKTCRAVAGRVEVCNSKYGNNGWLGIASIWASGTHITQGTVKLNDTYYNTAKYNTPVWRQFVVCQEIGHTFGLDHQDEAFDNPNLGTCMDYTSDPFTNQHPNTHDYEMLETIYAHLDTINTSSSVVASAASADIDTSNRSEWGREIKRSRDGRTSLHERDLGRGQKVFTFVVWAD